MAEYIEREAAKKAVDYAVELNNTEYDIVCDYLDRLPAADVAPVVHGGWTLIGADKRGRGGIWECSACRKSEPHKSDYCPNCGAKMAGGAKESKGDTSRCLS